MKIIKFNTINSTNSFLKELSSNSPVDDFTVIVTKNQTSGRGQMNTTWSTEGGKNLIFSILIKFNNLLILNQKYLSYAISVGVFEAINRYNLPKLSIKWPNDILSENDKIGGILIENSLQRNKIQSSIVGIGLNINQENFPEDLPNASSIINKTQQILDLDLVLDIVLKQIEHNINLLKEEKFNLLEEKYLAVLYKKNIPSMFKTSQNDFFVGKIIGVSPIGKLQIELEDETIREFGLKEVSFA